MDQQRAEEHRRRRAKSDLVASVICGSRDSIARTTVSTSAFDAVFAPPASPSSPYTTTPTKPRPFSGAGRCSIATVEWPGRSSSRKASRCCVRHSGGSPQQPIVAPCSTTIVVLSIAVASSRRTVSLPDSGLRQWLIVDVDECGSTPERDVKTTVW